MQSDAAKANPNTAFPGTGAGDGAGGPSWYPPLLISADDLGARFLEPALRDEALALMERITPDPYTDYVSAFMREGARRFGPGWRYADIITVLLGLSDVLKPRSYLEIGVRRGRSLCAVASRAPSCHLFGFDMWQAGYAGIENPGPDFVRGELERVGHQGPLTFVNGDSHKTLPEFFARNPEQRFDLITVDGDHSAEGARQDLLDVLPYLAVGGAVVFDDIDHPTHPELLDVWNRTVADNPCFSSWSFRGLGYGVSFALRRF